MPEALRKFSAAVQHATGYSPEKTDKGWMSRCPAHDDCSPSLSFSTGEDGRVLVKCFAGCSTESVVEAVGLSMADLFEPSGSGKPVRSNGATQAPDHSEPSSKQQSKVVATYDYLHELTGDLLYQVVRFDPKGFRQRRPDGNGGWNWKLNGVERVLYRFGEVIRREDWNETIFICEGEKDVDRLFELGAAATTCAGGAGKWRKEYTESFRAFTEPRPVAIPVDNDEAGRSHGEVVARALRGVTKSVKVVELPGLPEKGDVSDWLQAHTLEELHQIVEATAEWVPSGDSDGGASPDWPPVQPLGSGSLPEFPVDALPPVLRIWVEAVATATQTPPDMAALLALAVCASAVARKVEVRAKPDWSEPLNLFVAVLLEPGNRKSAVFADATRPLKDFERELVDSSRPEKAKAASKRRQDEQRLKALEKAAANPNDGKKRDRFDQSDAAIELAQELAETAIPVDPALLVDDVSSEKLGAMLSDQGGRMASMSPEGGVFDLMAGMYSKSGMPQFGTYLMAHAGDDLRTDRMSRDSVYVERPALTTAYAMQPAVLEGLANSAAFRGRGLLARFLYSAPESTVGQRDVDPPPVPEAARAGYEAIVRTLLSIDAPALEDILPIPLSVDARQILLKWLLEIEHELGLGGEMELIRDWGAKLAGLTLRLAGVMHCVTHAGSRSWSRPIDAATLDAAISIARYASPHAQFVLEEMSATEGAPTRRDAEKIWMWLKREYKKTSRRQFSKRDIHRGLQRHFQTADDLDAPLGVLAGHGYVRQQPEEAEGGKPGRSPSPVYELNPAAIDDRNGKRASQNPLTELTEPDAGHSEPSCVNSVSASAEVESSDDDVWEAV